MVKSNQYGQGNSPLDVTNVESVSGNYSYDITKTKPDSEVTFKMVIDSWDDNEVHCKVIEPDEMRTFKRSPMFDKIELIKGKNLTGTISTWVGTIIMKIEESKIKEFNMNNPTLEQPKSESNKTYIECECGTHLLKVQSEIDYHGENNEAYHQDFYLAMYNYGKPSSGFRYRLRCIWHIIKTGEPYSDQLMLSPDEAGKLLRFLQENIKTPYKGKI